jgi:sec-independent protein translocase protein TatB
MFGMGMTEILVILVIAVIFLGPDKLPEAASKISKGIRDIRKQTRQLQQTIEEDTEIGGAIKELKSALRGDEPRRPPVRKEPPAVPPTAPDPALTAGAVAPELGAAPEGEPAAPAVAATVEVAAPTALDESLAAPPPAASPTVTLPPTAGERDDDDEAAAHPDDEAAELARLIRPAVGTAKREGHG